MKMSINRIVTFLLAITYSTFAFAVDCNAGGTIAGEPFDKIIKPARRNIPGSDKQIVGRVLASERGLASKPAAAGSVAGADVPERAPAPANLGSYDVLGRWP